MMISCFIEYKYSDIMAGKHHELAAVPSRTQDFLKLRPVNIKHGTTNHVLCTSLAAWVRITLKDHRLTAAR